MEGIGDQRQYQRPNSAPEARPGLEGSRFVNTPTSNGSFSEVVPFLQIAWDSTSLGLLKECPRKYQQSMAYALEGETIFGYSPRKESVHLVFGLLYHKACEIYDHSKTSGKDHEEALLDAVRYTMAATWNKETGRPWMSDDKNKNRFTLVRTVVWYLDHFKDDPIKTIVLANGKPAVELSFRFETDMIFESSNEKVMLCGHFDRMGELGEHTYIVDRKTTKNTISKSFFENFSPDNQFSLYPLGANIVYSVPIHGTIVDGAQVAATFSRFERGVVWRSKEQLEEWYADAKYWIGQAEKFALSGYWPMNDKSCGNYGGCPFRGICSKTPSERPRWLEAAYVRRVWDPLQVRGDI
jgi:hypothetical protein